MKTNNLTARQKQIMRRNKIGKVSHTVGIILLVISFYMVLCMAGASDAEAEGLVTNINLVSSSIKTLLVMAFGYMLYRLPNVIWK